MTAPEELSPHKRALVEIRDLCASRARTHGLGLDFRQTNFEGVLIESVHEARKAAAGIIINPAGLSFTSVALLDALKTFDGPKIELHITNIHQRDPIYQIAVDAMAMLLGSVRKKR